VGYRKKASKPYWHRVRNLERESALEIRRKGSRGLGVTRARALRKHRQERTYVRRGEGERTRRQEYNPYQRRRTSWPQKHT
jgi:hypothetical protein